MLTMNDSNKIRLYAWVEFLIWLIVIALCVFGIRYHNYKVQKQYKSYQIFMHDVDGLIVGSPVRFLGIKIGHVTKVQLVSSDIYIKFIITQPDLELPTGSVATVESSGLGGSKSLEIYPPKNGQPNDKIIDAKDSTRLSKVMSLFNTIFIDLEEIFATFGHASAEINKTIDRYPANTVIPEDAINNLDYIDGKINEVSDIDKKIKKGIASYKKIREELKNESEQRESGK